MKSLRPNSSSSSHSPPNDQALQAAVRAVSLAQKSATKRATTKIEVTLDNGSQVDVQLDEDFHFVTACSVIDGHRRSAGRDAHNRQ